MFDTLLFLNKDDLSFIEDDFIVQERGIMRFKKAKIREGKSVYLC